jgi:ABC-type nitrate/sulfonate/bicarbonate transport system substrate-binding protein
MKRVVFTLCLLFASLIAGNSFSAARLEPLTIGYSNFTGTYAPLWIAVEDHLGAKYGLDLKAIYAGRIRPQQLLATGEVPIVLATATGTITSHILGVKDQVVVATITNKVTTSLFSKPEIKTVEELKGKIVATGRPGAFLDAMVRYVLRSKFNLVPDKDVKFLPSGEPALSLQALERGVVDGRPCRRLTCLSLVKPDCASWRTSTSSGSSIRTRAWWCSGKQPPRIPTLWNDS